MKNNPKNCCLPENSKQKKDKKGIIYGLIYGLIPHSFCIAYIILSVLGATAGVAIFRNLFFIPYLFQILIILSFVFATVSAGIYLKRMGLLSIEGIKIKWKYLTVLYSTIIAVNLLLFFVIFPATANINSASIFKNSASAINSSALMENLTLKVDIPCSGHANVIINELKSINGVVLTMYKDPDIFEISYDSAKTSPEKIMALEIFKTYKCEIIN